MGVCVRPETPKAAYLDDRAIQPVPFGQYLVTRPVARGGMAEIFRARTRAEEGAPARFVALKLMLDDLPDVETRARLFIREAKIARNLTHPNIVPVRKFGQVEGRCFLEMDFVSGLNLGELLQKVPRIPFPLALHIVACAARGIGFAHTFYDASLGRHTEVVHRDISPGNVMISFDGEVKVLDFGVARVNDPNTEKSHTNVLRGKFAYMSPEQALGEPLDARSDVFSLGVVLYELLTGKNPFRRKLPMETLDAVQGYVVPPPSEYVADLPAEVDRIVALALSKDRDKRFSQGNEFAEVLEAALAQRMYSGDAALTSFIEENLAEERAHCRQIIEAEAENTFVYDIVGLDLLNRTQELPASPKSKQSRGTFARVKKRVLEQTEKFRRRAFGGPLGVMQRPMEGQIEAASLLGELTSARPARPATKPRSGARLKIIAGGLAGAVAVSMMTLMVADWFQQPSKSSVRSQAKIEAPPSAKRRAVKRRRSRKARRRSLKRRALARARKARKQRARKRRR